MEIGITEKVKRDALESDYGEVSDNDSYDETKQETYSPLAQAVRDTKIFLLIAYIVIPIIIILLRSFVFVNIPKLDLWFLFSSFTSL